MGNQFAPAEAVEEAEAQSVLDYNCSARAIADYVAAGRAKNITVMLGAGVSVSAGIPDFRTPGTGLYDNLQKYNLPSPESIFQLGYFQAHPEAFYRLAKEMWPGQYTPTVAHYFVRLLHEKGLLLRCYSQNIDSLETRAGLPADKLVAAHGNFDSATCITTGKTVPIEELKEAVETETWQALRDKHGGLVKPDVVFFGESLPERFGKLVQMDFPQADLLIVMGTSLKVQPFASLIDRVGKLAPRLLLNREVVGSRETWNGKGFRFGQEDNYRDAALLMDCDVGAMVFADLLGWGSELTELVRRETSKAPPMPSGQAASQALLQWRAPPMVFETEADAPYFCRAQVSPDRSSVVVRWHCAKSAEDITRVDCLTGDALAHARQSTTVPSPVHSAHCVSSAVPLAKAREGDLSLELPSGSGPPQAVLVYEVWLVGTGGKVLAKVPMTGLTSPKDTLEEMLERLNLAS